MKIDGLDMFQVLNYSGCVWLPRPTRLHRCKRELFGCLCLATGLSRRVQRALRRRGRSARMRVRERMHEAGGKQASQSTDAAFSSKNFSQKNATVPITSNLAIRAWSIKCRRKKTNCTVWLKITRRTF